MTYTYDDAGPRAGGSTIRWSATALAGRQLAVLAFSVLLARLLGPGAFGVVAQATAVMAVMSVLMDQGLTASLISRTSVTRALAGAATTANVLLGVALAAAMAALAAPVAAFFDEPALLAVFPVLALSIPVKAAAVVPRMLLMRSLRFRALAIVDVVSAVGGGAVGVALALGGGSYWAIVAQLLATDVLALALFCAVGEPPPFSRRLSLLRGVLSFGAQVFAGNLASVASRNVDNILVGRFLGAEALGHYSLAYRVLLAPVQMIGVSVSRVLFPAVARARGDAREVGRLLETSVTGIALVAVPLMLGVVMAAGDVVPLVLGEQWLPAVPVLMVLAVTGARQALTSTISPALLGMARADVHLRFNLAAMVVQTAGIVAGLPFGIVGVAWGYTVAGLLLTPLVCVLESRIAHFGYRAQLRAAGPPTLAAALACGAYALAAWPAGTASGRLVLGGTAYLVVYLLALRFAFPASWRAGLRLSRSVVARSGRSRKGPGR
ncbi:lipopolysaccharide biosynthesis protein [Cellulomonas sp. NPDC055163]